jgi:hypothetical protein
VEFVEHLRGDASFPTVEELIAQLHADEEATRRVLAAASPPSEPLAAASAIADALT